MTWSALPHPLGDDASAPPDRGGNVGKRHPIGDEDHHLGPASTLRRDGGDAWPGQERLAFRRREADRAMSTGRECAPCHTLSGRPHRTALYSQRVAQWHLPVSRTWISLLQGEFVRFLDHFDLLQTARH